MSKSRKDFLAIITSLSPVMGKKSPKEQYTYAISVYPVVKILPPTCIKKEKTEINYLDFFGGF